MNIEAYIKKALSNYLALWRSAPASLFVGVLVMIAGVWLVETTMVYNPDYLPTNEVRLLWLGFLAFPFTLVISLATQRFKLARWQEMIAQTILLTATALYVWQIISDPNSIVSKHYIESGLWFFAGCLLIAVVPFISKKSSDDTDATFWKHTLNTIDGFLLAGLFGGLFFASTALALGAIDVLFIENFPEELYAQAFFVILGLVSVGVFTSWAIDARKEQQQTLHWLRDLLAKFIFIPVSAGYMVILYAYIGKLLLTQTWPDGGVGWWIIAFTVVTMGTYLYLLNRTDTPVLQGALAGLAISVLPQVIVLVWSMTVRVNEYGLTEWRYLAYVYAAWIAGVVIYTVLSKVKDRRWVFLSLIVLLLLVSVGPWRASSIAKMQQLNRLEGLLVENGVWATETGNNLEQAKNVDIKTSANIYSILEYLVSRQGAEITERYLAKPISEIEPTVYLGGSPKVEAIDIFTQGLGFTNLQSYYYDDEFRADDGYRTFSRQEKGGLALVETSGYDYVLSPVYWEHGYANSYDQEFVLNDTAYRFSGNLTKRILTVTNVDAKTVVIEADITEWLAELDTVESLDQLLATRPLEVSGDGISMRFVVNSISGDNEIKTRSIEVQPFVEAR